MQNYECEVNLGNLECTKVFPRHEFEELKNDNLETIQSSNINLVLKATVL